MEEKKNKETVEASILALNRTTKDSLHPRLRCAAVLQKMSLLPWTTQPDMGLRNLAPTSYTFITAWGENNLPGRQPGRRK